ncbi:hypothetical protein F5Y10DRAFT_246952 [Nemania abortiva]|nr:hypothetical protein F5Y10DRAFT_246952 [Nemania abortiva]
MPVVAWSVHGALNSNFIFKFHFVLSRIVPPLVSLPWNGARPPASFGRPHLLLYRHQSRAICSIINESHHLRHSRQSSRRRLASCPAATATMAYLSADDIPTLALLYEHNKLRPPLLGPMNEKSTSAYNSRIGTIRADITTLAVDVIVNAANHSLLGGGGVDGAIHRAAGRELLNECRTLNGCDTGACKITDAYRLPCKKVIHAVGPVYNPRHAPRCEALLRGCYQSALQLAVQHGLKTIAFCAIATGIYGYPSYDAASVACTTVRDFLASEDGSKIDKVFFVTFEPKDVNNYNNLLPRFFPPEEESSNKPEDRTEEQIAEAEATENQLPSAPNTDSSNTAHVENRE